MADDAPLRRPLPGSAHGHRRRCGALLSAFVAVSFAAAACSSSAPSASSGGSSTTTTAAQALLTRLTTDGSDAAFERRYEGDLGGDGNTLVFAGRRGDQAVVYACDGTTGSWFAGSVDADGYGTLKTVTGDGSVTLAAGGSGPKVTFDRGDLNGRSAVLAEIRPRDASLIRLEGDAATGGPNAAVGGIIVTPTALRGALTVSITDGSSNTITFNEASKSTATSTSGTVPTFSGTDATGPTGTKAAPNGSTPVLTQPTVSIGDGSSNQVTPGGSSSLPVTQPTTSIGDGSSNQVSPGTKAPSNGSSLPVTQPTASIGDGSSRQVTPGGSSTSAPGAFTVVPGPTPTSTVVSKTPTGQLTLRVTTPSSTTTTANTCAALTAMIASLSSQVKNLTEALAQLRQLRDTLTAELAKVPAADRARVQRELDQATSDIARTEQSIKQIQAQIDDLQIKLKSCTDAAPARTK